MRGEFLGMLIIIFQETQRHEKETIFVLKRSIFVEIIHFVAKMTYMHGPVVYCPAVLIILLLCGHLAS